MKVSQAINFKSLFMTGTMALLMVAAMFAMPTAAQSIPAASGSLSQCADGPRSSARQSCTGNWQNGNLNGGNSQYTEGESVAYRAIIGGTQGVQATITVTYDTTKASKHALDYLTSWDRNETGDPTDGTGVSNVGPSTFPIPLNNMVKAGQDQILGNADDITQVPGVFTLYGGTINSVSAYTNPATYTGDTSTSIVLTFTPGTGGTTVLAFGGHIGSRHDWGLNESAIAISGSPYHMNVGGGDRSMKLDGFAFPASVTIIKLVNNLNGTHYNPNVAFTFNVTAGSTGFGATTFNLTDVDPLEFAGASKINSGVTALGTAIDITEVGAHQLGGLYNLSDLACTETAGGVPAVLNTTFSFANGTVHIVPDEGEFITCTFTNTQQRPSAAGVSVSGRVTTPDGRGLRNAIVYITDSLGTRQSTTTSSFGTYTFDNVAAGESYVVGVQSKLYRFSTQFVQVNDTLTGVDFIGQQ